MAFSPNQVKRLFSKKHASDFYDFSCLSKILQSTKVCPCEERLHHRLFVHPFAGCFAKCHVHVRLFEEPVLLRVSDMHMLISTL